MVKVKGERLKVKGFGVLFYFFNNIKIYKVLKPRKSVAAFRNLLPFAFYP
jgi:hypothetical protein